MVRQGEHVIQCAQADAEVARRRKPSGWFTQGNGVCALCRCGLGKQYLREQRKEHEHGLQHQQLYQQYSRVFDEMTVERYERILREQAARKAEERAKLQFGMLGPLRFFAPGADPAAWLMAPLVASELKALLFDHACHNGLDPAGNFATPECQEAINRHVRCVQRAMLLKAAQAVLGAEGGGSRAATAWGLVA